MEKKNNNTPKYILLYNAIKKDIKEGVIKPGEKLMSEPQLMKKFGLARMTVRNALSMLSNEGLIERHHGKGTFCKSNVRSKTVDVLLDMSDHYFLSYNLQGISKVMEEFNATMITCDTKNSNDEILRLLREILKRGSDGVIVESSPMGEVDKDSLKEILAELSEKGIPYVFYGYLYDIPGINFVAMDEVEIGRQAGIYLKDRGHKNISAVLFKNSGLSNQRLEGFREIMGEVNCIYADEQMYDDLSKAIDEKTTAFFCFNDAVAQKCIDFLREKGMSVPDDISVISVDDTIIASAYNITSVAHAKCEGSEYAARQVISGKPKSKLFLSEITERNSVKNIL